MSDSPKRPSPREMADQSARESIHDNDRRFRSFHVDGFIKGHEAARLEAEELVRALELITEAEECPSFFYLIGSQVLSRYRGGLS